MSANQKYHKGLFPLADPRQIQGTRSLSRSNLFHFRVSFGQRSGRTRMHSRRMCTVHCSGRMGGGGGGCLTRGCVPRAGVHWRGGVSAQGGVCLGGVCLGVGGCTPPVNRIKDRCKDITFP